MESIKIFFRITNFEFSQPYLHIIIRPPSDDDKELYSIIARDVFTNGTTEDDSKVITLNNVIGLNEAKEALEDALLLPLQHPEIYKEQLTKVNGLLLVGPPGIVIQNVEFQDKVPKS